MATPKLVSPSEATNRFQQDLGLPKERTRGKVRDHMHPWVQEFIRASPFAVLASANASGACDASPRGGQPGFVHVLDERQLLLPDVAGNRLFQSFENIDSNPNIGLVFFIPGVEETVRVNGRAEPLELATLERKGIALEVYEADDKARNQQGLLIHVEEAYGHCPRALRFARLWNTETIQNHRDHRPIEGKPPGV